jgi:hypothetical protein
MATSYRTNAPSPNVAGSSQATSIVVASREPETPRTASRLGAGTNTSAVSDAEPVPAMLLAATVTVYEALFTRPSNVHDNGDVPQSDLVMVGAVDDRATTE